MNKSNLIKVKCRSYSGFCWAHNLAWNNYVSIVLWKEIMAPYRGLSLLRIFLGDLESHSQALWTRALHLSQFTGVLRETSSFYRQLYRAQNRRIMFIAKRAQHFNDVYYPIVCWDRKYGTLNSILDVSQSATAKLHSNSLWPKTGEEQRCGGEAEIQVQLCPPRLD